MSRTITAVKSSEPEWAVPVMANHSDSVVKMVLSLLGKPRDLWRITAHQTNVHSYRVNVWRELEPNHIRITDSFFLHFVDGEIVDSSPAITNVYPLKAI